MYEGLSGPGTLPRSLSETVLILSGGKPWAILNNNNGDAAPDRGEKHLERTADCATGNPSKRFDQQMAWRADLPIIEGRDECGESCFRKICALEAAVSIILTCITIEVERGHRNLDPFLARTLVAATVA